MPSSYSTTGLEFPADGEQSGAWGETTNTNMKIINRLTSEAGTISLSGTTHTLTLSDGILSDGHYAVLVFGGSPSGTNTVTISPNDAQRVFIVQNSSGQSVVLTQGTGGNVTVADGSQAIVYCDGAGTTAQVVDVTSTYLRGENNLSDIGDAATALTNLGLTATAAEINKLDGATLDLAAVTATADEVNLLDGKTAQDFFPSGGIIMWSGTIANIPSGWALCDGTNGTPDLTGRFVVHADADTGGTYAPGDTGGADNVTLTEAQMPSHTHSGSANSTSLTGTIGRTPDDQANDTAGVFNQTNTNSLNVNAAAAGSINAFVTEFDGTHGHTLSVNSTGGDASHENRPPYLALAYIMKL